MLPNSLHSFKSILGLRHNFQFWPHVLQPGAQLIAHQPLVIGNDSAWRF
jgi:hypothetical protein